MEKRSGVSIYVDMEFPLTGKKESVSVDVPFEIVSDVLEYYFSIWGIEARGKDLWNMLIYLAEMPSSGCSREDSLLDAVLDTKEIQEMLKEKYLKSYAYEEDLEDWMADEQDAYDWEHKTGIYAEDLEDEEDVEMDLEFKVIHLADQYEGIWNHNKSSEQVYKEIESKYGKEIATEVNNELERRYFKDSKDEK